MEALIWNQGWYTRDWCVRLHYWARVNTVSSSGQCETFEWKGYAILAYCCINLRSPVVKFPIISLVQPVKVFLLHCYDVATQKHVNKTMKLKAVQLFWTLQWNLVWKNSGFSQINLLVPKSKVGMSSDSFSYFLFLQRDTCLSQYHRLLLHHFQPILLHGPLHCPQGLLCFQA